MKIKVKLIIAFILISLTPLILVSIISMTTAQNALKDSIKKNFANLASEKAGAISFILNAMVDEAKLMASIEVVKNAVRKANIVYINKDEDEIESSITLIDKEWIGTKGKTSKASQILTNDLSINLLHFQENNRKKYGEIFITDRKGAVISMTKTLSDYYQADEEWWEYCFNNGYGNVFIDDRGYDLSIEALAIGVVVPIRDKNEVVGILKINYKVKEILEIVKQGITAKTQVISLVRSQGDFIAKSVERKDVELTNTEKNILNEKEAGYRVDFHKGRKTIMGFAPVKTEIFTRTHTPRAKKGIWGERWEPTRWYLFVEIEQSESFAQINKLINMIIIIVILVTFVVIAAALVMSKSISIPIYNLYKGTKIISRGDLDYKIDVQTKDEIGQLANSFNQMTLDLQKSTVSRHYVENIFKSMTDMLIVISLDAKIRTINQSALNLLGYEKEDLIGNHISIILEDEIFKNSRVEDLVSEWFISSAEKVYLSKDGKKIPVLFSSSIIQDDQGNVQSIVCVATDITERKNTEKQLKLHKDHLEYLVEQRSAELNAVQQQIIHAEKLSAIGKLSASIAHEFNNPICGIRNVLESLADKEIGDGVNTEDKRFINMSIKECCRIADLIKNLQNFHRRSTGVVELLDVHDTIDEVVLLCTKSLKERRIKLEKHYGDSIPRIEAVPDQIKQVVLNLIQNAEEAIDRNDGKIDIATKRADTNILIYIKDTGTGISADIINNLFEPFFTTTSAVKGTGLGLSICHGIIKKHGGDIEVESKLNEGTTFIIKLPIKGVI